MSEHMRTPGAKGMSSLHPSSLTWRGAELGDAKESRLCEY